MKPSELDDLYDLEERLRSSTYPEDRAAAADLSQLLHVRCTAGGDGFAGDLTALLDDHPNLPEYASKALSAFAAEWRAQ